MLNFIVFLHTNLGFLVQRGLIGHTFPSTLFFFLVPDKITSFISVPWRSTSACSAFMGVGCGRVFDHCCIWHKVLEGCTAQTWSILTYLKQLKCKLRPSRVWVKISVEAVGGSKEILVVVHRAPYSRGPGNRWFSFGAQWQWVTGWAWKEVTDKTLDSHADLLLSWILKMITWRF